MYHHLFWADELFQGCLLYIKGLCEDAVDIKKGYEHEDHPSAICLIKVGRNALPYANVCMRKPGRTNRVELEGYILLDPLVNDHNA